MYLDWHNIYKIFKMCLLKILQTNKNVYNWQHVIIMPVPLKVLLRPPSFWAPWISFSFTSYCILPSFLASSSGCLFKWLSIWCDIFLFFLLQKILSSFIISSSLSYHLTYTLHWMQKFHLCSQYGYLYN